MPEQSKRVDPGRFGVVAVQFNLLAEPLLEWFGGLSFREAEHMMRCPGFVTRCEGTDLEEGVHRSGGWNNV